MRNYSTPRYKIPRTWKLSEEDKEHKRQMMLGRPVTWGAKISESKKGHGWPEGYHENQSKAQKKRFETETPWNKGIRTKDNRGKRHDEIEYRKLVDWRNAIFQRDNYTCVKCNKRGTRLQADHIKMWAFYPELRYDIDNGQTLCVECHKVKTSAELSVYWKNQFAISRAILEMPDSE